MDLAAERDYAALRGICEQYRNWGRWGPDDQIGTLNFITRDKVVQAAGLVRQGKIFSLAIPLPLTGAVGSPVNPLAIK